eukprot:Skav227965  [mRNA]  locus=scaffold146:847583:849468:- [translate_table: standard]
MAGWDRGAPSQVVQNSLQSRLDAKDTPKWVCDCGAPNLAGWSHCTKCGRPPPQDPPVGSRGETAAALWVKLTDETWTHEKACAKLVF